MLSLINMSWESPIEHRGKMGRTCRKKHDLKGYYTAFVLPSPEVSPKPLFDRAFGDWKETKMRSGIYLSSKLMFCVIYTSLYFNLPVHFGRWCKNTTNKYRTEQAVIKVLGCGRTGAKQVWKSTVTKRADHLRGKGKKGSKVEKRQQRKQRIYKQRGITVWSSLRPFCFPKPKLQDLWQRRQTYPFH